MLIGVIDLFEMIHIKKDAGEGVAVAAGSVKLIPEATEQTTAIF